MFSPFTTKRGIYTPPSVVKYVLVGLCVMFPVVAAELYTAGNTALSDTKREESGSSVRTNNERPSAEDGDGVDYAQTLRDVVACGMERMPASLRTRILGAKIRPECTVALLRTLRAFQNFDPWALRLLDATGKYPTGLLQGSRADLGAFDECIETVVKDSYGNDLSRGQYCNLIFNVKNNTAFEEMTESLLDIMHPKMHYYKSYFSYPGIPTARLGICFLDDCSQEDLQTLVDLVKPSTMDIEVANCVTAEPEPWSKTQKGTVIFLGILAAVVAAATLVDLFILADGKSGASSNSAPAQQNALTRLVTAFSAASNTRALLKTADPSNTDLYALQFLHGLRLFSVAHIVLGHCYLTGSDVWSRSLNLFIAAHHWPTMLIPGAYNSVDTFFFLSGFFLCLTITKQRRNGPVVFLIGVLRRLIRTCVPLFFILVCMCTLPLLFTGPSSKEFSIKFQQEMSEHWWHLLVQVKNFYDMEPTTLLVHTWYLSADFQLFVVALLSLMLLKSRRATAVVAFVLLSLLSYGVVAWTLTSNREIPPMTVTPGHTPHGSMKTINEYYVRPFYHAMCYFAGCITFLLKENFREHKITKLVEVFARTPRMDGITAYVRDGTGAKREQAKGLVGWCVAASCMLCCVFMKFAWYTNPRPTSMAGTLLAAFSDRFLWSISLAWITLACSTGAGGMFGRFLSSTVFVPLSKLSFGIYLIHVPVIELVVYSSRERIFWSHFNQVTLFFSVLVWSIILSYLAYLACEAPTAALDRLAFSNLRGSADGSKTRQQNNVDVVPEKKAEGTTHTHF